MPVGLKPHITDLPVASQLQPWTTISCHICSASGPPLTGGIRHTRQGRGQVGASVWVRHWTSCLLSLQGA